MLASSSSVSTDLAPPASSLSSISFTNTPKKKSSMNTKGASPSTVQVGLPEGVSLKNATASQPPLETQNLQEANALLSEKIKEIQRLQNTLLSVETIGKQLAQQHMVTKQSLVSSQEESAQLRVQITSCNAKISQLTATEVSLSGEVKLMKGQVSAALELKDLTREGREHAEAELKATRSRIQETNNALQNLEKQLSNARHEIYALTTQRDSDKVTLNGIQSRILVVQGERDETKRLMEDGINRFNEQLRERDERLEEAVSSRDLRIRTLEEENLRLRHQADQATVKKSQDSVEEERRLKVAGYKEALEEIQEKVDKYLLKKQKSPSRRSSG